MRKVVWALIIATLISGCASIGTIRTTQLPSVKLGSYKTMGIQAISSVPDTTEELVQLETAIIARLRDAGLFEKVFSPTNSPDTKTDLLLKANITAVNRVSPGARVLLGAFAGRATISVEAELSENTSGKVIGSFTTEGKSSGGTIFAGTTPQAIDRAVEKIVEFVKNNM